nr:DUF1983 domain-containing protein [Proteus hauseri]
MGSSSAKTEQTSKVVTDINGKISASWTMKVQQDSKGNKVITGIDLGFNAQGNSQFLVNAQNFAVISSLNGKVVMPFVIQNGQAFFNNALFSKATTGNNWNGVDVGFPCAVLITTIGHIGMMDSMGGKTIRVTLCGRGNRIIPHSMIVAGQMSTTSLGKQYFYIDVREYGG